MNKKKKMIILVVYMVFILSLSIGIFTHVRSKKAGYNSKDEVFKDPIEGKIEKDEPIREVELLLDHNYDRNFKIIIDFENQKKRCYKGLGESTLTKEDDIKITKEINSLIRKGLNDAPYDDDNGYHHRGPLWYMRVTGSRHVEECYSYFEIPSFLDELSECIDEKLRAYTDEEIKAYFPRS